jgi:hypothetical protein
MGSQKRQLRNILIEPQFQLKLISYFAGLFVVTTLSLYSTVFIFFYRLNQKALSVGIPPKHVFFEFIGNEKHDLDLTFAVLAFFNFLILIGIGFLVSHRIAGPLYKLKSYLKNEIGPNGPDFKLRKGDFLREFEPVLSELKTRVRE